MRDENTRGRRAACWAILGVAISIKVVVAGYVGFVAAAAAGAAAAVGPGGGGDAGMILVGLFTTLLYFPVGAAIWGAITAGLQSWTLKPAPSAWIRRSAATAAVVAVAACIPLFLANRMWPVLAHHPGPIVQFASMAAAEGVGVFLIQRMMLLEPSWDDRHRL
jgi:hypothetical protein